MRNILSTTALALTAGLMASAGLAQAQPEPAAAAQASPAQASSAQAAPAQGAPAQAGAAAAAAATPTPGAGVTAGAAVKGPEGNAVGTIEAVDAQYATLATPNVKVKLPLNAFAQYPDGLRIGMTQAQLEQAAGAAASGSATGSGSATATTPPKLAAGATVSDTKGAPVGTIEEVSGDFATVATAKNKVRLPLTAFAQAESGPVIGMTEAELDAAADAAKPKTADK